MPDPSVAKTAKLDRYQELFERSADAILIIEGETFVDCNRAAVEMLRCSTREQVLQTHPSELSPPVQPDGRSSFEKANEMIAIARERGSHRFEWSHKRRDGDVFPVEVLLTAVEGGDVPVLHVVWRDLTERWQLEEQLRQSQKMEAVGKLAGGIAHDFNNLLSVIVGNCAWLERSTEGKRALTALAEIREASDRAATLVQQLMSFSRSRPHSRSTFDLSRALGELAPLLRRVIGEHIQLDIDACSRCPVHMDPSQYDQIILNLATNARDAMPNGGRLAISLATTDVAPADLPTGRYVRLDVEDNGSGMRPVDVRRAFEPFYTTKAVGEGTGFGLATVYGIVTREGGAAAIASEPDEGTTITVWLPLSEDEFDARSDSLDLSDPGGDETLLLVEDEHALAELIGSYLREHGYTVHIAGNGGEALSLVEELGAASIDLIVSDVIMPELSGPALVRRLRQAGHDFPVVFMSGYTDNELTQLAGEAVELLRKPFEPVELARRIRRVFASRSG